MAAGDEAMTAPSVSLARRKSSSLVWRFRRGSRDMTRPDARSAKAAGANINKPLSLVTARNARRSNEIGTHDSGRLRLWGRPVLLRIHADRRIADGNPARIHQADTVP